MNENLKNHLETWKKELLDIGKKNQMINFKNHIASTLEILSPNLSQIKDILGRKSVVIENIFDNKIVVDEFDDTEDSKETVYFDGNPVKIKDSYAKNEIIHVIEAAQDKSAQKRVFTNLGLKQEKKVLRNLKSKSSAFKEEYGIDILYLAIGFLNWYESVDSNEVIKSPLVLVPVKIEQQGFDSPFKLNIEDYDLLLNETLIKKIDTDFKLDFEFEFNSDDDTKQIDEYFNKIKNQFRDQRWNIDPIIKLGLFSFSKISMVKDIEENEKSILTNPIIKALSGEANSEFLSLLNYDDQELDSRMNPEEMYQVYDADISQEKAIQAAIDGKSFVLQGPPGTGKSQTITNIISELMSRGKKVLFVAEKKAALDVVYANLEKQELHRYALPLHNNKANKKELIKELNTELENRQTIKKYSQDKLEELFQNLTLSKNKLNRYAEILTKKQIPINKSLYEIYGFYFKYKVKSSKVYFNIDLDTIYDYFNENGLKDYIGTLKNDFDSFNYFPSHSIWWNASNLNYGYSQLDELKNKIRLLRSSFDQLNNDFSEIIDFIDMDTTPYEEIINAIPELLKLITTKPAIRFEIPASKDLQSDINELENYLNAIDEYQNSDRFINSHYEPIIMDVIQYEDILTALKKITLVQKSFSNSYKKIKKAIKTYSKSPLSKDLFQKTLVNLKIHNDTKYFIEKSNQSPNSIFAAHNVTELANHLEYLKWQALFTEYIKSNKLDLKENLNQDFYKKLDSNKRLYFDLSNNLNRNIENYFVIAAEVFGSIKSPQINKHTELNKKELERLILKMSAELDDLPKVSRLEAHLSIGKSQGLEDFINKILAQEVKEDIESIFFNRYYSLWIDRINQENPELRAFNQQEYDSIKSLFAKSDKEQISLAKYRISEILDENSPLVSGIESVSTEITTLKRESNKSRKIMPVRKLFQTIPSLILRLKPVIMMSPLSVSTYLNSDEFKFDTVIFDEASQIRPESSIGAIYRSNQAIIVGDKEQLPPTNFFNNIDVDDAEEDYGSFGSILDLANTALTSVSLKWHYRSKFEDLIYISNRHIYKNLITFPSKAKADDSEGVTYKFVADSIYYRGKSQKSLSNTNPKEAEFVIDEIFKHFDKYGKKRSLGIVTFNSAQQTLIENLLNRKRRQNDAYSQYFDPNLSEPFFIKNIETVQGDERDTIILNSVYGPGEDKRLLMNFGPLNNETGYRRLNVAITRAKYNTILVTSLKSTDLNLSRSDARGIELFKHYLEFAEFGLDEKVDAYNQDLGFDSIFEEEVYDSLTQLGYNLSKQVGSSGYKIDLAVQDKNNPNSYILGIECDGATYHSSYSARERDRQRQEVLEERGWRIHRIWSTDWFKNKNREIERIQTLISSRPEKIIPVQIDPSPILKENISTRSSVVPESNIELIQRSDKQPEFDTFPNLETIYNEALQAENLSPLEFIFDKLAPVHLSTYQKIIPYLYQRERFTSVVGNQFKKDFNKLEMYKFYFTSGSFIVKKGKDVEFRAFQEGNEKRNIEYIYKKELEDGLVKILSMVKDIHEEQLCRTLIGYAGFNKLTKSMEAVLQEPLDNLKRYIQVRYQNGIFTWQDDFK